MRKAVLILMAMLLLPLHSFAQDTRVQESRKAALEREIALIDKQLKENSKKSYNALNSLTLVRKKVADRKELLAESDRELTRINAAVKSKKAEIDRIQNRLDTLSAYYSKLISSAYRNRDSRVWYMYILASDNVGQAFRRIGYMRNLSSNLNRQGDKIKAAREELQKETDSLMVMKSQAQSVRNRRAADLASLQSEEKEAAALVSNLQRNKTRYQQQLASKKKQVDALNREIERIIASAVNGGKSGSKTSMPVDLKLDAEFAKNMGKLPWPATGPVVDHFGQHYHPVFTKVKLPFNNGINIALAKDTEIKSVFNGIVKQIVVMPGYGKCVLVQHGNYFSFYCRLGNVSVKAGDKVSTGDVIGRIDTIDDMTQLHFQIWQETKPQNPELWLR
ncbi:MAG: peptidoglycan DD-metalloendopeptidase family protein [Candidatus Cryptobacteroides sp.]|nr:peptidoglycan DD-metalloendopeptidase family protein [Candidatus Cryptobacteroides sp.]